MLKARVNFPGHGCAPLKGSKRHSSICEEISVVVGFYVFIIVVTVFHFLWDSWGTEQAAGPLGAGKLPWGDAVMQANPVTRSPSKYEMIKKENI